MTFDLALTRARALDAADPLAPYRSSFTSPDEPTIYLDGNSLGKLPAGTLAHTNRAMEMWANDQVQGWQKGWYELPITLGGLLAPLVGAQPEEVALSDSTTVNLYKLASAAMRFRPGRTRIVTDNLNFPSDIVALRSVLQGVPGGELIVVESPDGLTVPLEHLQAAVDERTALVSLSHTAFKSGFVHDLAGVTRLAHDAGALVLWDLSHSVGAVPVDLGAADADLAVGCTYKYLNGGPGAPAFLYVRSDLQEELSNPIGGWFGQESPFAFGLETDPAAGIRRFLVGTPPILSLVAIQEGIRLVAQAGLKEIRAKSVLQTEFLIELAEAWLVPLGCRIASPRDAQIRGSHVSVGHPHALAVTRALIARHRVVPDFRTPDNVRFGVSPLFMTFEEIARAIEAMRTVIDSHAYREFSSELHGVT